MAKPCPGWRWYLGRVGLSKAEWERRLKAALILREMNLSDLKEPVAANGLPVNAAARAGHTKDSVQPSRALALVVSELLDMPLAWFLDEEWRPLILDKAQTMVRQELLNVRADVAELGVDLARTQAQEQKWQRRQSGEGS